MPFKLNILQYSDNSKKILKLEDDIFDTFLIVQAETAESTTACTFNLPMIQYT